MLSKSEVGQFFSKQFLEKLYLIVSSGIPTEYKPRPLSRLSAKYILKLLLF